MSDIEDEILKRVKAFQRGKKPTNDGESVGSDLVCPITLALPFDPVTAEDGRVYERDAILKHIESNNRSRLKSPITNLPMGPGIYPIPQIKNIIEKSIQQGGITGELAEAWLKRKFETEKLEELKKKAQKGNGDSAGTVGLLYYLGQMGTQKDQEEAKKWFKMAVEAGDVTGMAAYGIILLCGGKKDSKECVHGLSLLSQAAGRSASASLYLGKMFAREIDPGLSNFPLDKQHAIRLLEQALEMSDDDDDSDVKLVIGDEDVSECKKLLKKLNDGM